jgi:CHC2 zinc finger
MRTDIRKGRPLNAPFKQPQPQRKDCMDSVHQAEATRAPRYRGVSYRTPIDAAKEAVPVIDLADRLCGHGGMRRIGREWVGHCVIPDHEDRTPSFTVNPEKNVWFCHGCLQGGDVVKLARQLGITESAVRKHVQRKLLEHDKEADGRLYVYLDRQDKDRDQVRDSSYDMLVRRLENENEFLRRELERKDTILLNMTEAMKALNPPAQEPPSEARESPETVEEQQGRGEPPATVEAQESSEALGGQGSGTARGSWWRRMFGG